METFGYYYFFYLSEVPTQIMFPMYSSSTEFRFSGPFNLNSLLLKEL